jgi:hypothetical protein
MRAVNLTGGAVHSHRNGLDAGDCRCPWCRQTVSRDELIEIQVRQDELVSEIEEQVEAPRQLDGLVRRKSDLEGRIARMHRAIEVGQVAFDDAAFTDRLKGLKDERVEVDLLIASLRNAAAEFPPLSLSECGHSAGHSPSPCEMARLAFVALI